MGKYVFQLKILEIISLWLWHIYIYIFFNQIHTLRKYVIVLDPVLKKKKITSGFWGEQDGRGVGGHGVYLSPQIHQEYRSAAEHQLRADRSTWWADKDI